MQSIEANNIFNSSQTIIMVTKHQTHGIEPEQPGKLQEIVNPRFCYLERASKLL